MREPFEKTAKNLEKEQTILVEKFLLKHANVFASSDKDLGRTDKIKHQINTGAAASIKQSIREYLNTDKKNWTSKLMTCLREM